MSNTGPVAVSRRFYVADRVILAKAALDTLPCSHAHPDALLLATGRRLAELWRRRDRLYVDGQPRHDQEAHARLLRSIDAAAEPLLNYVCACQSRTLDGHRARAATFLATDEGGLLARANMRDFGTERLLAAVVVDLLGALSPDPSAATRLIPGGPLVSVARQPGRSGRSGQLEPITVRRAYPQPTRFPALPRRYFPIRDLTVSNARACKIVEEAASEPSSPDAALVSACRELIEVDERRSRLLDSGRRRVADERLLAAIEERFASVQRVVIGSRPFTPQGHRARTAAFLGVDGNALFKFANRMDQHEARTLAALVFDLLDDSSIPAPRRLSASG